MTLADEPTRLRVIEGGGEQAESRKRIPVKKASGKTESWTQHMCFKCTCSALTRLRIGGMDVDGKLKGGADYWCCASCFHPYYRIRGYDSQL